MIEDEQTNRTMRVNIIFLISLFLCFADAHAQNKKAINPLKANADSIKTIEFLNKEIASRDKTIEKLNAEIEELKAKIREGKAAKYKQQIEQLKCDSLNLSNQLKTVTKEVQNVNKEQIDALTEQIDALTEQRKKDSLTIASLQNKLDELQDFRTRWLTQLAESVDEKWLSKPYSAIDINELERALQQYKEFAPADKRVSDARDKLKILLGNSLLYQKGMRAINSEYNAEIVNSLIAPMQALRDNMKDSINKKDVTNLYWQLNNYSITVEIFQEVIGEVNKVVKGQLSQAGAWPLANATLEKQEKESEYITAIQEIPWLAKQYTEYLEALKKDCTNPNPVGERIMNIKP